MLRVGLTGGIGSGKSTVAQRFRELGAVLIDADELAREVVRLDSPGLAAIRQRFGDTVIAPDGSLERGVLGGIVFADVQARKDLEAITHPLIGARTRELLQEAAPDKIVVHEVPLLAELGMASAYHLVVVVGADNDIRMARLTSERGFTEADARARISAQAGDRLRRAVADAWLDNNGSVDELLAQVDVLWQDRILDFNDNLILGRVSGQLGSPVLVEYDDSWPGTAARLAGRVSAALGDRAVAVEHIGSTSVRGLCAQDVIDLQVGVRVFADAENPAFARCLADKGFPLAGGEHLTTKATPKWIDDATTVREHLYGSSDPGRVVRLHIREIDGRLWRAALVLRDWLRAEADEREAYGAFKRQLAQTSKTNTYYLEAQGPWLEKASARADAWAFRTGWSGT